MVRQFNNFSFYSTIPNDISLNILMFFSICSIKLSDLNVTFNFYSSFSFASNRFIFYYNPIYQSLYFYFNNCFQFKFPFILFLCSDIFLSKFNKAFFYSNSITSESYLNFFFISFSNSFFFTYNTCSTLSCNYRKHIFYSKSFWFFCISFNFYSNFILNCSIYDIFFTL